MTKTSNNERDSYNVNLELDLKIQNFGNSVLFRISCFEFRIFLVQLVSSTGIEKYFGSTA